MSSIGSSRKLNLPLESEIQRGILDYLKLRGYLCKRNNSGKIISHRRGKTWAVNLGAAGWPDIIGLTKGGKFFGIEVKRPGEEATEIQKEIGLQIEMSGGIWFVAHSIDEVIEAGL